MREIPMYVDTVKYSKFDRHKNKVPTDDDGQKDYYKDKHVFTVDGYNEKTNTVFEANGCYWHGCRKCFPENTFKYNKTQERKNILEAAGFKVEEVWECQWTSIKQHMKNRKQLEEQARNQNIVVRDALFGGRTEGFKSYYCCTSDENFHYFDVVSLYPTVNALDRYPIGFGHYETYKTVDEFLFALDHDICFGLAKVHIVPPKNLYVPVLPDRSKGKLLFHLEPMTGTWTTIELKKALE